MKSLAWLLLSMMVASGARAADAEALQRQVERLSQRMSELERRLDALEAPAVKEAIQKTAPPANAGDSTDASNWSRLEVGQGYNEVRKLLGEPVKIRRGDLEFWFYSDKGADGPYVKFVLRQTNDWRAP